MKVLFVGNSHTYFNDMPQTFADMCLKGAGEKTDVVMLAYSWKDLEWHMSTEYFTVRFNIMYGGYDYCVIQQAAHPFPGEETTLNNAQRIAELCRAAGTVPIVIETWAEKAYPEHQELLSRANRDIASKIGALLAPVGTIFEKLRGERSDIELFWKDGEHAGTYGDLVIASTLYKLIGEREGWRSAGADGEGSCGCGLKAGAFDNSARDFVSDLKLDFHHPCVLEDRSKIEVELDQDKTAAVFAAVDEVMDQFCEKDTK